MRRPVEPCSVVTARISVREDGARAVVRDFVERGDVLAHRYRVEHVLGRGGMATILKATHLQLRQPVAIKVLHAEMARSPQVVQRFLREAQAAARLKSEHITRVTDLGTLRTGAPYMVLEYLEGADLASFPRAQLLVGEVVDLALQACEALVEAHSHGIVHRDVKPANLFITRRADGTLLLKLLDFGISKTSAIHGPITSVRAVLGTPAYMSPEQLRSSSAVDHRSDIWSLGVVLYLLLQGEHPFGAATFPVMTHRIVNDRPPKLTVPLPGDLADIVHRCLEKLPARRFQNMAELAHALAKHAQSAAQATISVLRTSAIVGVVPPHDAIPHELGRRAQSTRSGDASASSARNYSVARRAFALAAGALASALLLTLGAAAGKMLAPPAMATRPAAPSLPPPATTTRHRLDHAEGKPSPSLPTPTAPHEPAATAHAEPPASPATTNETPAPAEEPNRTARERTMRTNAATGKWSARPARVRESAEYDALFETRK